MSILPAFLLTPIVSNEMKPTHPKPWTWNKKTAVLEYLLSQRLTNEHGELTPLRP